MVVDTSVIAAASATILAVSLGLAVLHYRRALASLEASLRHQAALESKVVEGDARHRVLLDNAPIGCVVWEPGFRIVEWNRQAERIFGWKRDETIGRNLAEMLCREEDYASLRRQAEALFAGYAGETEALRHFTRDGGEVVCQWHHAAVHDAQGAPVRIVSMCVDITGLRQIERENTLFRSLVEHTSDPAIMVLDGGHSARILHANGAACRHFGLRREELVGKTPADWPLGPAVGSVRQHWQALAMGMPVTFETEHRASDGGTVPVEVAANPIEHAGNTYILCYLRDISARRAGEARLRALEVAAAVHEHEKRYREIFLHSSDALFSIDVSPDSRLIFASVNPVAEQAFGVPAAMLEGMAFDRIMAGELGGDAARSLARHMPAYQSCIATVMPSEYDGELELLPEHGKAAAHFEVRLIPLAGDGGIERIIGIGRDVTAQRKYEAELLERARLETLMSRYFAHAPGFFLTLSHRADHSWAVSFASPGIRDTHGIEPADAVSDIRHFMAVTHPDDVRMLVRSTARSKRTLARCQVEYRIRHPEKGLRWIECSAQPYRESDGSTVWHGFMHDITERRRMVAVLSASERQFRSLSENIPDNVARYTPEGRHLYVNPSLVRTLGLDAGILIGKKPSDLWPDAAEAYEKCLFEVARGGREGEMDISFPGEDGRLQHHHVRFTPEYDENGAIVSVLSIGRDITGRKQIEDALRFVALRGWASDAETILGAIARYLGETLAVDYVLIDRLTEEPGLAETAAIYAKGSIVPNMRYALRGTPCDNVIGKSICCYRENVQAQFPDDKLLAEMGVESYAGVPLWDSSGMPIGLIAVLDGKPLRNEAAALDLLQIMASRAAAELDRERAESALRRSEQQYRALADRSPDVIVRFDRQYRRIYVNATYESKFGIEAGSILGKTPLEAAPIDPSYAHPLHDAIAQVFASGRDAAVEIAWTGADERRVTGDVRIVPEFDDAAGIASVLAVIRDISALKESERRLIESRAQLRELTARREETREEERQRIARDLHEELGQVLTALRMNISTLPLEYAGILPEIQERTQTMLRFVDRALQGMRNTVAMLRPTTLDAGIAVGLEWLVREFSESTKMECGLHLPRGPLDLVGSRATTVFRIAQEALTNIARHAHARRADLILERHDGLWVMKVRDDGCGFDPKLMRQKAFGLRNMSERALSLGGKLNVVSSVGKGTTIKLRFPQ